MTAPVLMVQGTASGVGKSTLVAGLCRLLARRGLHVAPFKAQNMSNNAAVCPSGGEIGRAQYAQAVAAGVEATVDMNPILLKPQAGAAQVVVLGQVRGVRTAAEFFAAEPAAAAAAGAQPEDTLWPVVVAALDRLRAHYDLVVAEGAGSPAEINLRSRDLANMRVALHTAADVLLVADIDRGGAFAALLGTVEWLAPAERACVRGFILNQFRGDVSLLQPAPALLEARTGIPTLGVVPHLADLDLPTEDAASLATTATANLPIDEAARLATAETASLLAVDGAGVAAADAASVPTTDAARRASIAPPGPPLVEIAVVHLPHLSNFDELEPLAREPGVHLRYVRGVADLRAPDLVILPGTKATIPDLLWLGERGLAERIRWLAQHHTPILGICGGYQMLGRRVSDPLHAESAIGTAAGLDLLPVETVLGGTKQLARTRGRLHDTVPGFWGQLGAQPVEGYEIHLGQTMPTVPSPPPVPLLDLGSRSDGAVSLDGWVAGTSVHGLWERPAPRHALLHALAAHRGLTWRPSPTPRPDPYDRLADVLEASLDLSSLPSLATLRVER